LYAGVDWIYALIAHEIATHHNPYLVLKLLKNSGKYIVIGIAALILSFGAGMGVMHLIHKYASQKEIDEAMQIVSLAERGEF